MRTSKVGHALSSRWGLFVLVAICVSYMLVFTQRTGPGVIADQLQREFHVSAAVLGTITSVQYLLYMVIQIPVGLVGDRYGPERLLVTGVLCDGIGTIVFVLAHNFGWLLIGRAIVGFGDSLIWVNIVLILAKWFAKGRFAAVLAAVNTAGNMGAMITSIPLAAWIAVSGWHVPFMIIGLLLVAVAIVDYFVLGGGRTAKEAAKQYAGEIQVQRVSVGKMLGEVVKSKLSWATFCCHFGAVGTYLSMVSLWVVPYFMNVYQIKRSEAAWFTLTAFIGALIASPVMGWLSDFIQDRRRPYVTTQVLTALAWLTVFLCHGQPPLWVAVILMFVVGYGSGTSLLTFAAIRDHVPDTRSGLTSGFANTGGFLSAVLLPVLFGVVIDMVGGTAGAPIETIRHAYGVAFILPAAFATVGVIGSILLPKGVGRDSTVLTNPE